MSIILDSYALHPLKSGVAVVGQHENELVLVAVVIVLKHAP